MHKYLLLLAAAALTLPAQAQTERGSKLLGVSVGNLTYTDYADKDRVLSAAVTPSVGWFVLDRLAVGTGLIVSYEHYHRNFMGYAGPVVSNYRTWGFGLAPFARYYFVDAGKHKLFAQLSGQLTRFNNDGNVRENGQERPIDGPNYTERGWFAGAGYNYFLSANVALEATAGYQRRHTFTYTGIPSRGSVDVQLGLSVFLPSAGRPE